MDYLVIVRRNESGERAIKRFKRKVEKEGINIRVFDGDALCIACEGGPTCLTRPLLRL